MVRRIVAFITLSLLAAFLAPAVRAGTWTVYVDPGTQAYFGYTPEGDITHTSTALDSDGDGKIEFTIPDADQAHLASVWVVHILDGKRRTTKADLNLGSRDLRAFEPCSLPTFEVEHGTATLFGQVDDLVSFLPDIKHIYPGQWLNVSAGTTSLSTHLRFRDGSALPANPDTLPSNPAFVASLPNYSGGALVGRFYLVRKIGTAIPMVTTPVLAMLSGLLALAGVAMLRRRGEAGGELGG